MSDDDGPMVLRVLRSIDGERVRYTVDVPRRGLVGVMREENCKPGVILETELHRPEVTT